MTSARHLSILLMTCTALVASVSASAQTAADGRRLERDGDVAEAGDCDIETALERKRVHGDTPERRSTLRLNCGIGWLTELEVAHARGHGGTRRHSIALESKTTLRERAGASVGWALALGVAGERGSGNGWRRSEQFVALEATMVPARDWLLEAKLGAARERSQRLDKTMWTLAAEHVIGDSVEWRAEIEGDDRHRPLATLGLRWTFWPERAALKVSYGASSGPQRERRTELGIKVEF